MGLVATSLIPEFDFVSIVPTSAAVSVISLGEATGFPLKVSPANFGMNLDYWPDLNYGSLAVIGFLAKAMLTGHPRGIHSYLDVLPFDQSMPIGRVADLAQRSEEYSKAVAPLVSSCKVRVDDFNLAFRHAYCLYRRHAIPFWTTTSSGGAGHPAFEQSEFIREGKGDILGMVPVLDLALHSPTPNASIGFPDAEMVQWLKQERKIGSAAGGGYFVLQALKDIQEGEIITLNKNAYFGFDDDTFKAWFGFPNASQVPETTSAAAPSDSSSPVWNAGAASLPDDSPYYHNSEEDDGRPGDTEMGMGSYPGT